MPLHDLTPQLRTRLSRIERAVGWFITIAVIALIGALGYYLYVRAESKGWFVTKVNYRTSLNNAAGLKVGDPVKLMGFNVGEITQITPNAPDAYYGVTIDFRVRYPYYGYIWMDSKVRVAATDFLGNRSIEVLKGHKMQATAHDLKNNQVVMLNSDLTRSKFKQLRDAQTKTFTNMTFQEFRENARTNNDPFLLRKVFEFSSTASNQLNDIIKAEPQVYYTNLAVVKGYWLEPLESPALTERLESVVTGLEVALPNILNLTNELTRVLTNAGNAVARLDATVADAHPLITNLTQISYNLRDPNGSLGTWILGTELRDRITSTVSNAEETLKVAHSTLNNTDTNLTVLATQLEQSLVNLAQLTGNLNAQVQTNGNLVSNIDKAIADTDDLVQGLKHHWFLRSAFKKENAAEKKAHKK